MSDDAAALAAARLVEAATKVDEAWDVRTNAYDITSYVAKTTLDEMYQRLKAMRSALDALAALPAHPPAPDDAAALAAAREAVWSAQHDVTCSDPTAHPWSDHLPWDDAETEAAAIAEADAITRNLAALPAHLPAPPTTLWLDGSERGDGYDPDMQLARRVGRWLDDLVLHGALGPEDRRRITLTFGAPPAPLPLDVELHQLLLPPHLDGYFISSALCSCGGFQYDADTGEDLVRAIDDVHREWHAHAPSAACSCGRLAEEARKGSG